MTLDELVVDLKLDTSQFTEGQKAALAAFEKSNNEIEKKLRNLEHSNKKATYSFGDMNNAAQGLFTTLVGVGMEQFLRRTVDTASATGRMATNAGVATKEMGALGLAVKQNGGSAASAEENLLSLSNTMQSFRTGKVSQDFLMGWSQLKIAAPSLNINSSPDQLVMALAKFKDSHNVQETIQAGQRIGMGMDLINVASKGSAKALDLLDDARKRALTPEQVAALTALQSSWNRFSQGIEKTGINVAVFASGPLGKLMEGFENWRLKNEDVATSIVAIITALGLLKLFKPLGWMLNLLGMGVPAKIARAVASPVKTALAIPGAVTGMLAGGILVASTKSTASKADDEPMSAEYKAKHGTGGGGTEEIDAFMKGVAAVESRGKGGYNAVGEMTEKGDRAYGKYQVMGENIGPWSQEHLGKRLSIAEFLASAESQDKIAKAEMLKLYRKHKSWDDVASVWFTGGDLNSVKANRTDVLKKLTGHTYAAKVRANMPTTPKLASFTSATSPFDEAFSDWTKKGKSVGVGTISSSHVHSSRQSEVNNNLTTHVTINANGAKDVVNAHDEITSTFDKAFKDWMKSDVATRANSGMS